MNDKPDSTDSTEPQPDAMKMDEFPGGGDLHPHEWALRTERLPHIWCPGCGIGTGLRAFTEALAENEVALDDLCVVSGIGCTGRSAGYFDCDSFHVTHGRAIPFATGLHVANPDLEVVVFSGDGDLAGIGGNHLIHAARRNIDMTVVCINNFTYGMTGGQHGPTTPTEAITYTTPAGNPERPFNLPRTVGGAGATYVARWTTLDLGRVREAFIEALDNEGFSFVEVISPCPINYGRLNDLEEAIDDLRQYLENTRVDHLAPLNEVDLERREGEIVVGTFVDEDRPTLLDRMPGIEREKPEQAAQAGGSHE